MLITKNLELYGMGQNQYFIGRQVLPSTSFSVTRKPTMTKYVKFLTI